MRKQKERKSESQAFLLEPLLALTGSLTLTQTEAVPSLHKCDIPTQLYLGGKVGLQEAILWLYGPTNESNFDDANDENMLDEKEDGWISLDPKSTQTLHALQKIE
jgi:hypothetical protein